MGFREEPCRGDIPSLSYHVSMYVVSTWFVFHFHICKYIRESGGHRASLCEPVRKALTLSEQPQLETWPDRKCKPAFPFRLYEILIKQIVNINGYL